MNIFTKNTFKNSINRLVYIPSRQASLSLRLDRALRSCQNVIIVAGENTRR